jgi:hypothetical protein
VTSPPPQTSAADPVASSPPVDTQPTPPALQIGGDDDDWSAAQAADTYDAYTAYLKAHPQGQHVAEARRAAADLRPIAKALKEEPPIGQLPTGASVLVDDHSCKRGEIKVVTGGDVIKKITRTKKCVPRDQFP